jgi:ribosomal protein L7/L12
METSYAQILVIVIVVAIIAFKFGSVAGRLKADSERIKPISTTRISPEARARIDDALRRGNKIEAIRILREDAGCGLAEAKQTIETLASPNLG